MDLRTRLTFIGSVRTQGYRGQPNETVINELRYVCFCTSPRYVNDRINYQG